MLPRVVHRILSAVLDIRMLYKLRRRFRPNLIAKREPSCKSAMVIVHGHPLEHTILPELKMAKRDLGQQRTKGSCIEIGESLTKLSLDTRPKEVDSVKQSLVRDLARFTCDVSDAFQDAQSDYAS